MARHLTKGDRRFLAAVGNDPVRKLDAVIDSAEDALAAAEAAGVMPAEVMAAVDRIQDDDVAADPDQLDDLVADLGRLRGRIQRGEIQPREEYDERAEENRAALAELRQLKEEWGLTDGPTDDGPYEGGYDDEPGQ